MQWYCNIKSVYQRHQYFSEMKPDSPYGTLVAFMDIEKMLAELREERELIEGAIVALERLAQGGAKRRGRPPKWMVVTDGQETAAVDQPRKRRFSAEARKRMAEAQRKRWASRKKAEEV
jgi:hypothetical protein